jgi:DNA-binding transcriptional regulator YiaG
MARDEALILWGRNIAAQRKLHTPAGNLRQSGADPTMSQADLAAALIPPVAQSTVARWEAGRIEPRRHYKVQLATILHCDVAMLFPLTRAA